MNRRDFAGLLAGLSAIASLAAKAQNAQPAGTATSVTCLIHPNMVMMDLVAPLTVLNLLLADIRLVAKSSDPVSTELGLPVVPTHTFATAPRQSTVLFVPGGLAGSVATMQDQSTLNYLAEAGAQSDWVTSVCTGSLLLAAAGLLDGYRATSHWYVNAGNGRCRGYRWQSSARPQPPDRRGCYSRPGFRLVAGGAAG